MAIIAAVSCNANGRRIALRFPGDLFISQEATAAVSHSGLRFETEIEFDSLWRRTDYIVNTTSEVIHIDSVSSVLEIPAERPELTIMRSGWGREAQAEAADCASEPLTIESPGRSCYFFRPCAVIGSPELGRVILNLLPLGDWQMTFDGKSSPGKVIVEIGHPDQWALDLPPGEKHRMGISYLIQIANTDAPVGHFVQRYALDKLSRRPHRPLPVVYNSWFDRFHRISWESLTTQLEAAAEIGCEAFVLNAGWFGPTTENWDSVGDWRENPQVFGEKPLAEFADLVRSKGLGFGLWMEPERVKADAPIRKQHPDWFVQNISGAYYPNLLNPDVRDWVMSEMVRLIETYGVRWFTIDCNHNFSPDPENCAHELRMKALYEILDEIAERYPDLILEGCASGGLRADLLTASHFHTHFLSDTVDPVDIIRIGMSVASSLPPRMMNRWAILYPTNRGWTIYNREAFDTADLVLSPATGLADKVSSYRLNFAVRAAMTGVMGIGGNIAGLDDDLRCELAGHIRFYKEHRDFIQNSVAIPLTPVESIEKRSGVSAIQLSDREFNRNMLFIYNIASRLRSVKVSPLNLDEAESYDVLDEQGQRIVYYTGDELSSHGLDIECGSGQSRVVFVQRKM